jgi:carboxymethylenebutenolidase
MAEIKTQTVEVTVADGTKMTLHWAGPGDDRTGPGMIVFQEAFGVNEHIRDIVRRFAREGFWAAAPELFHRTAQHFEGSYTDFSTVAPHMQAVTQTTLEADTLATYAWLKSQPKVNGGKIAAVGFCLGGRATYVANATVPLKAAISFYGGGIAPDLLPLAAKQHGPLLMFWGGLDKHITPAKTRAVADALTAAGKSFVNVEFSDADHAFFCDARQQYQAKAATEAWALSLAFLKNRL